MDTSGTNVEMAVKFLTTIFDKDDQVLFRPIETWNEGEKKQSRVIYKQTVYRTATESLLDFTVRQQLEVAIQERANVFFGVCPRVGAKYFDLAWQIRTVRVLWADIDHVTVEEATARVRAEGLPEPSIAVNSGNGVHLYWLLDHLYLIDDVGTPPKVMTRFIEVNGKKKAQKYFVDEHGDEVPTSNKHLCPKLSPKAERFQDVLAGIAAKLGGDHTTDLSRLLRVPATLNRKNERNGQAPKATELVWCDPTRRYVLSAFEHLAVAAPTVQRREQLKVVRLPEKKRLSSKQKDTLNEAIMRCGLESKGRRSETDFAVCCAAIELGMSDADLWSQVAELGKFKECGRDYFDRTWQAASDKVKEAILNRVQNNSCAEGILRRADKCAQPDAPDADTIVIDSARMHVRELMRQISDRLLAANDCFLRLGQCVVINGEEIQTLLTAPELAGKLNHHVEFFFAEERGGGYKPLPTSLGNTWLHHPGERVRLPEIKLFTRNPVFSTDWRLVAPGFDTGSGIYYAGQVVAGMSASPHLDRLLREFCFKTPADRTNYIGVLLTTVLIPHFIGAKPAALFNGNQPGLGKSILAQIISILRDGHPTETASYNPNDEEFEKRLGAIVRRGVTTIIIDNAKGQGRKARIESACLERSITDAVVSFRLLGKSQEIRAENSHIFCITANTTDVGPDLVSRSVVINLWYEGNPKRRTFEVKDPEAYAQQYRFEILGELIGMIERWRAGGAPRSIVNTRFNKRDWGGIVGGILEFNGEPDFLANAEEAAAELDDTRRDFSELLTVLVDHPQGNWTATELVELCLRERLLTELLSEGSPRSLATRMGSVAGRFIDETFDIPDGRCAAFRREKDRKGNVYRVVVLENVPNLDAFAEPRPNLAETAGSAL